MVGGSWRRKKRRSWKPEVIESAVLFGSGWELLAGLHRSLLSCALGLAPDPGPGPAHTMGSLDLEPTVPAHRKKLIKPKSCKDMVGRSWGLGRRGALWAQGGGIPA